MIGKRRRWLGSAVGLTLALAGCGRSGDPVRDTLDRVVQAARARDAKAVRARLSDDYRDAAGDGPADAEGMLRGYFAAYEIFDVRLSDVTVERAEGAARARFRVDLSGQPRRQAAGLAALLPAASAYRFDVRLTPDGSKWKIAWASWEPIER